MADLDLAGIITRVCANLRLRFSTVAVVRILTSGTKSATVTVDGVEYDLYAPTPPTASTTAPLMDGTASYGSGTSYARSNHVHPTDTSRQATLVSGTNIKTVGGTSLLGSGDIPITITMEDTDVDAAVEAAWLEYSVTLTLTNPANSSEFSSCEVFQQDSADLFPEEQEMLGTITSPTGSATFAVSMPYMQVIYHGMSVAVGTATCTGGVSLATDNSSVQIFQVTGDGTIVSDGVDYDN